MILIIRSRIRPLTVLATFALPALLLLTACGKEVPIKDFSALIRARKAKLAKKVLNVNPGPREPLAFVPRIYGFAFEIATSTYVWRADSDPSSGFLIEPSGNDSVEGDFVVNGAANAAKTSEDKTLRVDCEEEGSRCRTEFPDGVQAPVETSLVADGKIREFRLRVSSSDAPAKNAKPRIRAIRGTKLGEWFTD